LDISLPLPGDKSVTHKPRGELVDAINPAYLSYWNPDAYGRAFYFAAGFFAGLIPSLFCSANIFIGVARTGAVRLNHPIEALDIAFLIFIGSLPVLSGLLAYFSVRTPLRPPTFINRKVKRVYCWHGNKNIDGGWMFIDWNNVVPVTRRVRIATASSSSTLYVLQLLEVDPHTKAIRKTIPVVSPQIVPELCGEIWEFIRNYMDGPASALPVAVIDRGSGGFFGFIVKMHETAFQAWIRADGTLSLGPISFFFAPAYAAITYVFVVLSLWIERVAPMRKLPKKLEQANRWVGTNPYVTRSYFTNGHDDIRRKAMKLLPLTTVLFLASVLFHSISIGLLIAVSFGKSAHG
jgi:hypothetical protein